MAEKMVQVLFEEDESFLKEHLAPKKNYGKRKFIRDFIKMFSPSFQPTEGQRYLDDPFLEKE
jgi:hypothetical protein